MNASLQTQTKVPPVSLAAISTVPTGFLQRKCACSGSPGVDGECAECRAKRLGLQRQAASTTIPHTVPAIVHEVRRSPRAPCFGHDFGQVRVHSGAPRGPQASLAVNQPGDEYEQEADRVAEQVMRMPAHPAVNGAAPLIQRFAGQPTGQTGTAPASVDRVLASHGRPLDPSLQQDMGQRFGYEFSQVRVHSGSAAEQSARAVNAQAYTVGHNIVFGAGQHAPGTTEGQRLLAHELTHVIQQDVGQLAGMHAARSAGPTIMRKGDDSAPVPSGPAEEAPEASADTAKNVVYSLTFDDGPHAAPLGTGENYTEKVLDTLASKGAKAGFFIQSGVTHRGANPIGRALVARISQEGHTVGVHTGGSVDHEAHPSAQTAGRLEDELESSKKFILDQTGSEPEFVRPPFGKHDADVDLTYKRTNLTMLKWDIDGDKEYGSLDELKSNFNWGMRWPRLWDWEGGTPAAPKIVILYHDIRKITADNIGEMIDYITSYTADYEKTAKFEAP